MKRYSPAKKNKIIEAATEARKQGKKWTDALAAAKEVGYKGSLQGIAKMLKDAGGGKVKGKPGRKPGRKAGYTKADPITSFVNKLVEKKLRERVRKAIAVLKGI